MPTLDIIIAGAGMGGLSAALALQQAGHRVRLFERAVELAPIGAAISIWPNGVKVLDRLGLGPAIAAVSGDMRTMSYHDQQGQLLTRFSLLPFYDAVGRPAQPIARAQLQRLLLDAVGAERVTLGVGCEGFAQDEQGVTVTLSDGRQERADLLIAADGTHSRLRDRVVGQSITRDYCGYVNWNGRVKIAPDLAEEHEWAQFVGNHQRVSLMPMGGDEFYFFFDVPLPKGTPNDRSRYREELAGHFAGWAPPVQRLIERLDPQGVARVEIHDTRPLTTLVRGRVALLGDSAHSMAPDLGQGGCQAMEDAWVLARCLEADADPLAALQAYEQARVERVAGIVERARKRCEITHGQAPEATRAWYAELAEETGETVIAGLRKTADGGPL
ncbi:monooxygenase [Pseudomonas oryzihabitans]|uniref:FAD-dependent urate hydroxylase HpxO n=1 Tax=Pseudomonas rhizoryzae TaxID=2571129 RepID=UPI0007378BFF|nr:FAD-dependent urate hydroxylase HpxO [Pseudomonas rhizoryzae]KTT31078.1 monooxygenase [Pseudomonas psychrotolerans]KTT33392.1 monooxygenase [Pseudomonas psychrotolerans]KTT43893.1 monooxygenase [Pseudomonas psychrotolerans]KTT65931.1 monooxygenase [Pseudomonas psychrotolerans]KTT77104.1 monooxygenase [Pseudomonas psychrotolerans]